jgi:hypothetical protein
VLEVPAADRKAPMKVVIAGGGIGGLVLAVGLLKRGFDVTVLERDMTAIRGEGKYRGPIQVRRLGSVAGRQPGCGQCYHCLRGACWLALASRGSMPAGADAVAAAPDRMCCTVAAALSLLKCSGWCHTACRPGPLPTHPPHYRHRLPPQIQSNALGALEALDQGVADRVYQEGCITGDRINGLCDGVTGDWCATAAAVPGPGQLAGLSPAMQLCCGSGCLQDCSKRTAVMKHILQLVIIGSQFSTCSTAGF